MTMAGEPNGLLANARSWTACRARPETATAAITARWLGAGCTWSELVGIDLVFTVAAFALRMPTWH